MHLLDAGVQNRLIFSGNVTRQPMLKGIGFRADPKGYPNADQIMRYGTMLPCHPTMDESECEYLYESVTASQTARAVFYSALTTITSFGSLALSAHRGLAGLGTLLVIGMVLTLACNLLVLPALIHAHQGRRGS